MKRLITILAIMIVLVGAVFAADGDKVLVTATVAKHEPGFKIFGGADEDSLTIEGAATPAAANTVATGIDIALEDITVYFKLTQYSVTNTYSGTKAKFKGVATLTVAAEALSAVVDSTTYSSNAPTCADARALTVAGISSSPAPVNGSASVTFTLTYDGRSVQDTDVATFNFTWAAKDELPPAQTYSANVTLTYTVV